MPDAANPAWRVLYVEDDRVAVLLFSEALREMPGLSLEVAETGAEALQIAAQWQPDALVLDANLPDTTAVALLPRLRALPGLTHTPAFLCSADSLLCSDPAVMAANFTSYWLKPVQPERWRADLAACLPPR
ncbi:response regulator [Aquabacterium sp.]|uniref:response regulator n=1 Tax=Aquabacterium sp. TaxID=1872578 RepID=UPI0037849DDC